MKQKIIWEKSKKLFVKITKHLKKRNLHKNNRKLCWHTSNYSTFKEFVSILPPLVIAGNIIFMKYLEFRRKTNVSFFFLLTILYGFVDMLK